MSAVFAVATILSIVGLIAIGVLVLRDRHKHRRTIAAIAWVIAVGAVALSLINLIG